MKILVTGGKGMLGMALQRIADDNLNFVFVGSKDCDLRNIEQTDNLFATIQPDMVVHLAAKVGGLFMNLKERVSMFRDNVRINENVLEMSNKYNVQYGVFCLSSCIFPHSPPNYPMTEDMIHNGEPHPSNEGYAYAKRMLEMQCRNYNQQFGRQYMCITPVNLYGPNDNFNLETGHVIPSIIHKVYLAIENGSHLRLSGDGKAVRQFLYVDDLAKIIISIIKEKKFDVGNVMCSNDEISIRDLVQIICNKFNFNGDVVYDNVVTSNGCQKKTVCNKKLLTMMPNIDFTPLNEGISSTIDWFTKNYNSIRK